MREKYLNTELFLVDIFLYSDLTRRFTFKYGVISGPCFPVFGLNTGKYGPEITRYLDTFHAVLINESLRDKDKKF